MSEKKTIILPSATPHVPCAEKWAFKMQSQKENQSSPAALREASSDPREER